MFLKGFFKNSYSNKVAVRSRAVSVLLALAAFSYWPWLFYSTRTTTPDNTYQVQAEIDKIIVKEFLSGPQLYIYTADTCYECNAKYTSVDREKVAQAAAERIEKLDGPVVLTVFDIYSRHPLFSLNSEIPVERRVIGLHTDTEVIWSVEAYNSTKRFARVAGIFIGIPLTLALFAPLYIILLRKPKRRVH